MTSALRPMASLSLDLDDRWAYLKTHGEPGWERWPSFLEVVVPRVLKFLAARRLRVTVFIVGQDAALPRNRDALGALAAAGHEIGNHSFHHEPWWLERPESDVEAEIERAGEAIEGATGVRPRGFRGPGFTVSPAVIRALARHGYRYDASTLPTFTGPLARAYYRATMRRGARRRPEVRRLFGGFGDGLRPLRPYRWRTDAGTVVEIPVTTLPGLRLPFHVSYLLWIATASPAAAARYFEVALALCRLAAAPPSVLLHALDFLGAEDAPDLAFFPAMRLPRDRKLALLAELIGRLQARHATVTLGEQALTVAGGAVAE